MNTSLKHQVRKSKTYKIDSGGGWGGGTGGREPGSIGGGRGTGGGREKGGKQEFWEGGKGERNAKRKFF